MAEDVGCGDILSIPGKVWRNLRDEIRLPMIWFEKAGFRVIKALVLNKIGVIPFKKNNIWGDSYRITPRYPHLGFQRALPSLSLHCPLTKPDLKNRPPENSD